MAIEKVKEYLKTFGRDGDVQEFDVSSATVNWPLRLCAPTRPASPKPSPCMATTAAC